MKTLLLGLLVLTGCGSAEDAAQEAIAAAEASPSPTPTAAALPQVAAAAQPVAQALKVTEVVAPIESSKVVASIEPTIAPTVEPTVAPTVTPTAAPTVTATPTVTPTATPTPSVFSAFPSSMLCSNNGVTIYTDHYTAPVGQNLINQYFYAFVRTSTTADYTYSSNQINNTGSYSTVLTVAEGHGYTVGNILIVDYYSFTGFDCYRIDPNQPH